MDHIYLTIMTFMEQGGDVLWFIAALTFFMWTLIVERIVYFRTEHNGVIRGATEAWEVRQERKSWGAHQVRERLISEASERIQGNMTLIQTCIMLCPLLGLLGTVTGMIAVFDAMATQGGNARSMASGVSQATIPTMAGMIASLSGLFAGTFLKQKVEYEVELLEDHLTVDH
jgi:biopolymer transport protein ExbB